MVGRVLTNVLVTEIVLLVLFCPYMIFVAPDFAPRKSFAPTVLKGENDSPTYLTELQEYFPSNSWVLNTQNYLIRGEDYVLIFDGFDGRDKTRLRSKRFAALFFPKNSKNASSPSADTPKPAPVIVVGEDEVEIHLAGSVSDSKVTLDDFVWGKFKGAIHVTWNGRKGDGSDAFTLEAANITYENHTIQSEFPVTFQFMSHIGHGTAFTAELEFITNSEGKTSFEGIRYFDLIRLDSLVLHLTRADIAKKSDSDKDSVSEFEKYFGGQDEIPIHIDCEGPVSFQKQNMQITFQENVHMEAMYPTLPHDTISCDNLVLSLSQSVGEDNIPEMTLEQISAISQSTPLRIQSPSRNLSASGRKCDLNILTSTFSFSDQINESTIQVKNFEFHAKFIDCTLPVKRDGSSLPTVNVDGSGWLRYQKESRSGEIQSVRVNWRESLEIRPDVQDEYAILFRGDVTLNSPEFGSISAPQLHIWLKKKTAEHLALEKSLADANPSQNSANVEATALFREYYPARLLAERISGSSGGDSIEFRFTKENLTFLGTLDKIELWMEPMMSIPEVMRNVQNSENATFSPFEDGESKRPQRYRITAGHLMARLLIPLDPHQMPFCPELRLQDGIQIIEEPDYQSSEIPVHISGAYANMTDLTQETLEAVVVGEPALVSARGLEVQGPTIHINCKSDSLWMNNGKLKYLFVQKGKPDTIEFQWDGKMEFRGKNLGSGETEPRGKIYIRGNSTMEHSAHRVSNGNQLAIKFAIPFDFSNPPKLQSVSQNDIPQILTCVTAYGTTTLQSQMQNNDSKQTYVLNAKMDSQLDYDPIQNVLHSDYNGWANITFPAEFMEKGVSVQKPKAGLFQMDIQFSKGFSGNLNKREFSFSESVRVVGNPVPTWDSQLDPEIDPFNLDSTGFVLTCGNITINQIPKISSDATEAMDFEFLAQTQVSVEVPTISAHGDRLKYSSEKELITLEGNPASITRQESIGTQAFQAKYPSIRINIKTHTFTGEMNSVQGGR